MKNKALGLIEVYGYLTAVEVLDVALKSADVQLVSVEKIQGGLVTVIICGDVSSVKASIDSATLAGERVGKIHSTHVIPRPFEDVYKMIIPENQDELICQNKQVNVIEKTENKQTDIVENKKSNIKFENINMMSVKELRTYARKLKIDNIVSAQIKYAKKIELIKKINEFIERGDN